MNKIAAIVLLIMTSNALATSHNEKVELSLIQDEVRYLKEKVQAISKLAKVDDEIKFNYQALVNDLDAIEAAIGRHVNAPRVTPKKLPELEAEYGDIH